MIFLDVDTAVTVHVNLLPLIDDTDFKSREVAIAYDQAGMDLVWNFTTGAGVITQTAVTPTTGGVYDWTHVGDGIYKIEIPASGGGSINNDAEGYGFFSGICTGVLPWRGPVIGFRAAAINNALVDGGDNLDVNATQAGGQNITAAAGITINAEVGASANAMNNLETLFDGVEGFAPAYAGPRGPGVYLNDAAGNTNTTNGVDGTWANPVSTIAAAKTIADALSVDRVYLVNDSAITLGATMADYEFVGIGAPHANSLALASQDVDNSTFHNLTITGVQGGTERAMYVDCIFGVATLHALAHRCGFADSATGTTLSNDDDGIFDQCFSMVAGNATPVVICSGAGLDVAFRHYSGGIELKSTNATAQVSIETDGQVVFNADCNVNTNVTIRGWATITDNTAGMNSITYDATAAGISNKDGNLTYDMSTDSLEAIRDRGDSAWTTGAGTGLTALASGTAQSGTASTVVLASGEAFADNILNGNVVKITAGTGAGQSRVIISNTLADDTCNIAPNWTTNPSSDSVYEIVPGSVNVEAVSLDNSAANNLELDYDGTGYAKANSTMGTVTLTSTLTTYTGNTPQTADVAAGVNLTTIGGDAASLTALKDFVDDGYNPVTHTVVAVMTVTSVTGDVSGSVGSVVGNVDGNVTGSVGSVVGHTAQTGDTYALANGATGFAAIDTVVDSILALFTGITSVAQWLGLMAGKQVADATALAEIKATGAGSGTFSETTDSLEGSVDGAGGGDATAANQTTILANIATAQADLDTITGTDGVTLATAQALYAPNVVVPDSAGTAAALHATTDGLITTADTVLDALVVTVGVAGAGLTEAGGTGDHLTAINLPNQTMDIIGNITGNLSGSVGSVTGAVGSVTGAVGSVTGAVGSVAGNVDGSVASVTSIPDGAIGADAVADIFSTTTLTEAYAADGAAGTPAQIIYLIQQLLFEISYSGTTATVKKLDGTTTAATGTLDDATSPTSITRAT